MTRIDLIALRRGTSQQWGEVNPVLALGEPGFETDTNKMKLGDGSSPWSALEYLIGDVDVDSLPPIEPIPHVHPDAIQDVYGEASGAGHTSVTLMADGGALEPGAPGVPVPVDAVARSVAVSFMADNVPSGPWVAKLWRRVAGGTFNVMASFSVPTS